MVINLFVISNVTVQISHLDTEVVKRAVPNTSYGRLVDMIFIGI